ncbi:MAG: lipid-A-disaccharide synthase [Lentisphaeria bacterium]|jgi:lipid-A-disaccharide synthase
MPVPKPAPMTRIALVVGEESGDILGAGLIAALKKHYPNCQFEGIGGPRMIAEGFLSHFSMERLAVMGLVEPLKRLPELLSIRSQLRKRFTENPPDVFIGIDAPDFNLTLEESLRRKHVLTVHYVSPSVWAWRQWRLKRIARSVDLMLTLFPFETKFYENHRVSVAFVGHPLADDIPLDDIKNSARSRLNLDPNGQYVALLPGSRRSEVEKLGQIFLQAARLCKVRYPELKFLVPAVNATRQQELSELLTDYDDLFVRLSLRDSHDVMAAADVVLMASGTTTLEAMLLKRPMVIAYRMAKLSFWIISRMVKSKYIGLPNLLADKLLVSEFIQNEARAEKLSEAVLEYLDSPERASKLQNDFLDIHRLLRKNASESAASEIVKLWETCERN